MTEQSEFAKALEYTFRILARQDYSKSRIRQKLLRREVPESVIGEVIAYLEELNYLDERRSVKNLMRSRFEYRHWGPYKVRRSLHQMGYESDTVAEELREIDDEQVLHYCEEALADYYRRKPDADREKVFRFLAGRGFPVHIICQALSKPRQ